MGRRAEAIIVNGRCVAYGHALVIVAEHTHVVYVEDTNTVPCPKSLIPLLFRGKKAIPAP